ncbi:hypothetical protein JRI60_10135 [Archangium violaceum]|uniref:hypothetical protein n=1 Tax=Archangium violaceum TaxID=83451 RepID=UPI0019518477|nr:hypothetical protein [Archangium violaceum]QRN99348.1 hypothetical protein JRI60_10135 [Archangium violaceum]
MDEREKSGSSGEDAARVGPYRLEEQAPQDDDSQGGLYRATHETSGAPALVRESIEDEKRVEPRPDVRVRLISSASQGYDAMEVEQTPWSVAPERQSVESLVSTLEEVHEAVGRMVDALSGSPEPSRRWHLGGGLLGAAVVGALLFALVRSVPEPQTPSAPESTGSVAPAPMRHEVTVDIEVPPTGNGWLPEAADGGVPAVAHPFPRKPYKGQRRPPCKPRVEVEIMGACWIPHKLKAPCPEELYEYKGECYTTSMQTPPTPQSVGE